MVAHGPAAPLQAPEGHFETSDAAQRRRVSEPVSGSESLPVDGVAVARLYGEPLFAMPQDLYIPPDALEVFL